MALLCLCGCGQPARSDGRTARGHFIRASYNSDADRPCARLAARVTDLHWAVKTAALALERSEDSFDVYRLRKSLIVALELLRRAS